VIQWRRSRAKRTTAVRVDISSRREAPGHAVGLRSGTTRGSCCWRSAAHRGTAGQRSGRGGAAWSAWEKARGGAKAVGELEGDAWSGAGAGESLGRRGTTACGGAAAGQRSGAEEEEQGVALGADLQFQKFQGPYCKLKFSTILKLK
jgi:hypothetical protein